MHFFCRRLISPCRCLWSCPGLRTRRCGAHPWGCRPCRPWSRWRRCRAAAGPPPSLRTSSPRGSVKKVRLLGDVCFYLQKALTWYSNHKGLKLFVEIRWDPYSKESSSSAFMFGLFACIVLNLSHEHDLKDTDATTLAGLNLSTNSCFLFLLKINQSKNIE